MRSRRMGRPSLSTTAITQGQPSALALASAAATTARAASSVRTGRVGSCAAWAAPEQSATANADERMRGRRRRDMTSLQMAVALSRVDLDLFLAEARAAPARFDSVPGPKSQAPLQT